MKTERLDAIDQMDSHLEEMVFFADQAGVLDRKKDYGDLEGKTLRSILALVKSFISVLREDVQNEEAEHEQEREDIAETYRRMDAWLGRQGNYGGRFIIREF